MDEYKVELTIYSPRWGHEDIYEIKFSKNQLVISQGPKSVICNFKENVEQERSKESLDKFFKNEYIYIPAIFHSLLELAWTSWRNEELESAALNDELQELAKWLNIISKAKPKTEYWSAYF